MHDHGQILLFRQVQLFLKHFFLKRLSGLDPVVQTDLTDRDPVPLVLFQSSEGFF